MTGKMEGLLIMHIHAGSLNTKEHISLFFFPTITC